MRKQKIDDIQETGECLTSRGGLAFFKRYIDEAGYVSEISERFSSLKKSAKGIKIKDVVAQLLSLLRRRNEPPYQSIRPEIIEIMIDMMPINNDDAEKREGVEYTYKRFNGFSPLNFIWDHRIIDTTLFGGSLGLSGLARRIPYKSIY